MKAVIITLVLCTLCIGGPVLMAWLRNQKN